MKCKALFVASCVLLAAGCQEEHKQTPRGLLGPDGRPLPSHDVQPAQPPSADGISPAEFQALPDALGSAAPKPPSPSPPQSEKAEAPPRDLASELGQLIPPPSECLDLAQLATQGPLSIAVRARVAGDGTVSSVTATIAPAQSRDRVRCIERRISQGRLSPNVPGAPLSVEAKLAVEVVAQQPASTERKLPPPTSSAPQPELAQPENGEVAQPDGTDFAQPSQ